MVTPEQAAARLASAKKKQAAARALIIANAAAREASYQDHLDRAGPLPSIARSLGPSRQAATGWAGKVDAAKKARLHPPKVPKLKKVPAGEVWRLLAGKSA